ncbi:unnamed protein product [Acanthoscelides obtectus]|uniref:Uncharacterized protein n=1 Tax=Acanthoscelides obtectus TaxID=200917 RepID=A0A9P0M6N3_ACAOB|nr:unnamed protein product [Acanthoscelides obtectus]CAK1672137.1 hypothetical protein AOBTE_LOCUS28671 [Acanthoscelides obtectus]
MPFWICQQTSGISASKIGSSTCRWRRILRKTIKSFKTTYRVVLFPYAKLKRHPSYVYPHSNYSL